MGDDNNSANYLKTGSIAWDKAKIIQRETHWQRRRVKEVIQIQKRQESMHCLTPNPETI